MAFLTRNTLTPLLLTYESESSYLHIDAQGCALFFDNSHEPSYRIQEPLLLAHGIMTGSKTVHLVVLKSSGDLCYTLISGAGTPQTTLIAKLDVRATRYRRIFLLPQGKIIHIFYASTHQSIPELWRIEHRFWNGVSWRSTHMGEIVHPREPLYHVNLDNQGNLHFCTVTFQGRYSLLFTNRFNGAFHLWGSPTETMKMPGEVVDMAALMTTDNVHHLFWVIKTPTGQFELRSAQQTDAHVLASSWHPSIAPIKTFNSPCKSIGALEIGGVLWLLVYTGEEVLLQNDGKGWKPLSVHAPFHKLLQWVHRGRKSFHQTYWLEDKTARHAPAYYRELGFTVNLKVSINSPNPYNQLAMPEVIEVSEVPKIPNAPETPKLPETTDAPEPLEVSEGPEAPVVLEVHEELEVPEKPVVIEETQIPEIDQLQSLIKTVAHLEQENTVLSLAVYDMLSKFDQIMGLISENALQPKQKLDPPPSDELEPVKEAMAKLEKETQSLSQVLRLMLDKQDESDSSLEKLETQISQLQSEKADAKNKGGLLNKWIT
ncbi:MAG: hypothetical protein H6Q63_98 [Firmicutes bacterium]|nr:hypothetical protein [Bacillota bacterium]